MLKCSQVVYNLYCSSPVDSANSAQEDEPFSTKSNAKKTLGCPCQGRVGADAREEAARCSSVRPRRPLTSHLCQHIAARKRSAALQLVAAPLHAGIPGQLTQHQLSIGYALRISCRVAVDADSSFVASLHSPMSGMSSKSQPFNTVALTAQALSKFRTQA
eukprot:5785694-Amphidinium_carterae.1